MQKVITGTPKNAAAWALKAKQRPLVVSNAPYSSPPPDYVAIRILDVAINPIDWIMQSNDVFGLKYPSIFGIDVAGEIVEVGKGASEFKPGEKVIAHCDSYSSKLPSHGAFQRYALASKDAVAELPSTIPPSVAVVLPLSISTAAAGLYQKDFLALPYPSPSPSAPPPTPSSPTRVLLVWGASSSIGSSTIQLAKASGLTIYAIASSRNFAYCERLGAAECFDYHDADVEDQLVRELEGRTLVGAYHAAGTDDTVRACARVLDRSEGKAILVSTRGIPGEGIPGVVRGRGVSATTIFTNEVGRRIWRDFLPKALESGTVVPKPDPLIVGEGLRSIQLGLDKQKAGVSALKVVVTNIHLP